MIECPQVAELIAARLFGSYARLCAGRSRSSRRPHPGRRLRTKTQLAERMDRPQLVGDIVTHWHKFGERRKTVAFAVNVAHSVHLRDEFVKSGVRCEHIDGSTPKDERDATLARLESGELELVTNCMVLTEGWDMPVVGTLHPGATDAKNGPLSPDDRARTAARRRQARRDHSRSFSGAVFRHGFVEDRVHWTLDPDRRAESPTHQQRCAEHSSRLIECTQCGAIRTAGEACFHCGFLPQRAPRAVVIPRTAISRSSTAQNKPTATAIAPSERARWHAMLIYIGDERGYKAGWAAHKYKEKFGVFPAWGASPESNAADGRSQKLGALAPDRLRETAGRMKRKHKDRRAVCAAHDRDAAVAGVCGRSVCRAGAFLTGSRSNSRATAAGITASCRSRSPTSSNSELPIGMSSAAASASCALLGFVE